MKDKVILVSGSHRSGSTWLGKIIAEHSDVYYVSEPFNIELHPLNNPVACWFEYICDKTTDQRQIEILDYIKSYFELSPTYALQNLQRITSLKEGYYLAKNLIEREKTHVALIKDPIAFFSADWISKSLNAKTIILIRHPAAFVASIKLKNWTFDFHNILNQNLLMKAYLSDYQKIIEEYAENQPDIIDQAICLWNLFHDTILQYQKINPDWYFIKHEDLSRDPLTHFENIFNFLNLELTDNIREEIINSTTSDENTNLRRNSKENIKSWKKRLSETEISRIKEKTYPIWHQFYEEKDW